MRACAIREKNSAAQQEQIQRNVYVLEGQIIKLLNRPLVIVVKQLLI